MSQDESIASLRCRVAALVEQESTLLTQAFEISHAGGDRLGVDALFAQVQAIQVERNSLKKQIGNVLGTHRLHVASEVWRVGVYDYRPKEGGDAVRVRVTKGPLGLQVLIPRQENALKIETLDGTFDGPLGVDEVAGQPEGVGLQDGGVATSPEASHAPKANARGRRAKKNPA